MRPLGRHWNHRASLPRLRAVAVAVLQSRSSLRDSGPFAAARYFYKSAYWPVSSRHDAATGGGRKSTSAWSVGSRKTQPEYESNLTTTQTAGRSMVVDSRTAFLIAFPPSGAVGSSAGLALPPLRGTVKSRPVPVPSSRFFIDPAL